MNTQAKTVAVVDYGMGNLRSVAQAVQAAAEGTGWTVVVTQRPEVVRAAQRVVLPGLGLIRGVVRRFDLSGQTQPDGSRYKVPQMGWNQVPQMPHGGAVHPLSAAVPDH